MRSALSRLLLRPSKGALLSRPPATAAAAAGSATGRWKAAAVLPLAAWTTGSAAAAAAAAATPVGARLGFRRQQSSDMRKRETSPHDAPGASSVRAAVEALQEQLAAAAAEKQERLQRIKTEFGSLEIGAVTPQKVVGGMRGLTALLTETSVLEAESGLRLHGIALKELLQRELPKISNAHEYPPIEALLWFLLTSKVPTPDQVSLMQRCLYEMSLSAAPAAASPASGAAEGSHAKGSRSSFDFSGFTAERFMRLPKVVTSVLRALPNEGHPMAALIAAAASLSDFSFFRFATEAPAVDRKLLWKAALPDALSLQQQSSAAAAKQRSSSKAAQQQQSSAAAAQRHKQDNLAFGVCLLLQVVRTAVTAATIYANKFGDGHVPQPDPNLDFAANFARMLGLTGQQQRELIRLYLLLHADHEGGNVSAHASHLVGSALADPFAAFAAGMAGLGGPLHGLANQKCLAWLRSVHEQLHGEPPTKERIREIALATLKSGNVIPGFGHAVLRVTDPRFLLQREFALRHIKHDPLFKLLEVVREVVPEVLAGRVSNPYPNVDCHSGILLQALGLTEERFYTVLFGVSRSMGIAAQFVMPATAAAAVSAAAVWARALGLPIERPKSLTTGGRCLRRSSQSAAGQRKQRQQQKQQQEQQQQQQQQLGLKPACGDNLPADESLWVSRSPSACCQQQKQHRYYTPAPPCPPTVTVPLKTNFFEPWELSPLPGDPSGHPQEKPKHFKSVFDRLTDSAFYTGVHRERFDELGNGRGLAGREYLYAHDGMTESPSRTHEVYSSVVKKPRRGLVAPGTLGVQRFGLQTSPPRLVWVFRNGDKHHDGSPFFVKAHIRTLEALYQELTKQQPKQLQRQLQQRQLQQLLQQQLVQQQVQQQQLQQQLRQQQLQQEPDSFVFGRLVFVPRSCDRRELTRFCPCYHPHCLRGWLLRCTDACVRMHAFFVCTQVVTPIAGPVRRLFDQNLRAVVDVADLVDGAKYLCTSGKLAPCLLTNCLSLLRAPAAACGSCCYAAHSCFPFLYTNGLMACLGPPHCFQTLRGSGQGQEALAAPQREVLLLAFAPSCLGSRLWLATQQVLPRCVQHFSFGYSAVSAEPPRRLAGPEAGLRQWLFHHLPAKQLNRSNAAILLRSGPHQGACAAAAAPAAAMRFRAVRVHETLLRDGVESIAEHRRQQRR
ncbi:hypothetical protein ACSSS7_005693 [Eimeria intestinalis]